METITQLPVFASLEDAYNSVDESSQITIQELLNGRVYLKGLGWSNVSLTMEFRKYIAQNISERLGGRGNTPEIVKRALQRQHVPQHWGLDRFVIAKYGDTKPRITYIAGQDSTWEYREIRNYLKNV